MSRARGGPLVLALDLPADRRLQRGEVVEAEMLGERVVDPGLVRAADLLDRDGEARRPALELLVRIVLGEVDLDGPGVARQRAEELFLEARDELPGAEPEDEIGGGAALEWLAVEGPLEIDRQLVAVLRRRPLLRRG